MLCIDQPFGAGFSTCSNSQHLSNTDAAAVLIWKFIQIFYDQFPQYKSRNFGMWSESYVGRMFDQSFFSSLSFFPCGELAS